MKLRIWALLAAVALIVAGFGGIASMTTTVSAASASDFDFDNGRMSEQVLRNYLSRAVTGMAITAGGGENLLIDENIRFLLRTGTKFVSRAALFAWDGLNAKQVEEHFQLADTNAKKVHVADPEIILQAFVAEIVRRSYINDIAIPAWVFEAFGEEPEERNFVFEDIINEKMGPDFWGSNAGYPDWSRPEAQRWYYYCIVRYIDAGYESIHIQEGEYVEGKGYDAEDLAACDKVLTMARAYAKDHARRGIVLFHNFFAMSGGGCKIGNRLVFDIHGNGLVPNETEYNEETGAYECRISYPEGAYWCTWLGRSVGGEHPLGFTVETCPTILELDNYGPWSTELNISNGPAFGTWGYDDISWYATQPEAYRNEFLLYLEEYTSTNCLSKEGERQYYILFPMARCITASPNDPTCTFTLNKSENVNFLLDYTDWDRVLVDIGFNGRYNLTSKGFYRANRQSDGCPNGFNQENTIREIFLGKNTPEDPKWDTVVLPEKYTKTDSTTQKSTTTKKTTTSTTAATKPTDGTTAPSADVESSEATSAGEISAEEAVSEPMSAPAAEEESVVSDVDTHTDTSAGSEPKDEKRGIPLWGWITAGTAAILAAAGMVVAVLLRKKKYLK